MSVFDWNLAGAKSQLGDQLSITFGESTSAVFGLNGTIVLGNKIDYIIDPFALGSTYAQAVAPFLGMLFGRNQIINGNNCMYVLGQSVQMFMGGRPHFISPNVPGKSSKASLETLAKWWQAANICAAIGMLYTEGAGSKVPLDWSGDNSAKAAGIQASILSVSFLPAVVVLIIALWFGATKAVAQMATSSEQQAVRGQNPGGLDNVGDGIENHAQAVDDVIPNRI